MAERNSRKRSFILISSDEEEDDEQTQNESEDDYEQSENESESQSEADDDDDYNVDDENCRDLSDSICRDDDDACDENDSGDKSSPMEAKSICQKIVCLLQGKSYLLQTLSLIECKAYLREHGLRLSGTKTECIDRIKEHWRVKHGNGEAIYPRSSFNVHCTGDVCKGDVVLFTQRVYDKFDKVTRNGDILGKRTIAGRVVKESYGAAKQQHTFTVEVLWSKGLKKLPPLFPLLVKGRNLYKLKTYRQRWENEAERVKVLDEKHKRGTAARLTRAMNKSNRILRTNTGAERRNDFNHNPSRKKQRIKHDKGKRIHKFQNAPGTTQQHNQSRNKPSQAKHKSNRDKGKSTRRKSKSNDCYQNNHEMRNSNFDQNQTTQTFPSQSYANHHHRPPWSFPPSNQNPNSYMTTAPQFRPYSNSFESRGFNTYHHHANFGPDYEFVPRNRPPYAFPVRTEMPEPRRYGFF